MSNLIARRGMMAVGNKIPMPPIVPTNQMWYQSTDGQPCDLSFSSSYTVTGRVYEQGFGKITFSRPSPLTTIETGSYNDTLKYVFLPNTVQNISGFRDSKNLTFINVPDGVTNFSASVFARTRLKKIMLPSSISSYPGRFLERNTTTEYILSKANPAPTFQNLSFYQIEGLVAFLIPAGSMESYLNSAASSTIKNALAEYIDAAVDLPEHTTYDYCLLDGHILYKWQDNIWLKITDFNIPD